ncbi:MAG: hypothetical protein VYA30_10525 [Myxococcota bacterium]|nr:hypothetical protein [Myxococcota bacterium]
MMALSAFLHNANMANSHSIVAAEAHSRTFNRALIESFVGAELVEEEPLVRGLSKHLRLARVSLDDCVAEPGAIQKLSAEDCRRYLIFPIEILYLDGFQFLLLAMANPLDVHTIRAVYRKTGLRIRPLITTPSDICSAIVKAYQCPFEPLMGIAPEDINESDEGEKIESEATPFFDAFENMLGPYIAGQEMVELDPQKGRKALRACLEQSDSVRDILLVRLMDRLIEKGQLDVSELLKPDTNRRTS